MKGSCGSLLKLNAETLWHQLLHNDGGGGGGQDHHHAATSLGSWREGDLAAARDGDPGELLGGRARPLRTAFVAKGIQAVPVHKQLVVDKEGHTDKNNDFFTKEEMEANKGKVDCNFKAMMLGNQVGKWQGNKAGNAWVYTHDLKGQEVKIFWPERMSDGECNDLTKPDSKCWQTARLLNDHQCREDDHCLHYVLPSGETASTYSCPTWVKSDDGRCKLPYGYQACPEHFTVQRYDSGVPYAMDQTTSRTCGIKQNGLVMVGNWVEAANKSTWTISVNDTGNLQATMKDSNGDAQHAELREDINDWYTGEVIKTQDDLKTGKELRVRLNKNGEVESQSKPLSQKTWDRVDTKVSYEYVDTFGGDAEEQPCIFPFDWNGQTYHKCTTEDSEPELPWCMTSTTPEPDGKWGYCKHQTPSPPESVIGTHGGTATPGNCTFPFNHEGKPHDSCITEGEKSPWCKTDKIGNWGFCNCKVPEEETPGHPIKTHGGSSKEPQQCHFPFKYKGKVYTRCITEDEKAPWCMTGESGGGWGFCDCKEPLQFNKLPVPSKDEVTAAEETGKPLARTDHCMGDTTLVTNPNMIFDLKKNTWYRCSPEYICENWVIRAIKPAGSQCGSQTCPADEQCFVHNVDSKTSTFECVPQKQVWLIGTSDEDVYDKEKQAAHTAVAQGSNHGEQEGAAAGKPKAEGQQQQQEGGAHQEQQQGASANAAGEQGAAGTGGGEGGGEAAGQHGHTAGELPAGDVAGAEATKSEVPIGLLALLPSTSSTMAVSLSHTQQPTQARQKANALFLDRHRSGCSASARPAKCSRLSRFL